MKAIEKWASDEFRSVNGKIEWMLVKSLKEAKRFSTKKELLNTKQKDDL